MKIILIVILVIMPEWLMSQNNLDLFNSEYVFLKDSTSKEHFLRTISNKEFVQIISLLDKASKKHNLSAFNGSVEGKYYFQLLFVKDKGEGRWLYVNAMCELEKDEKEIWGRELIEVNDGGSCYFNLLIDLSNNSYKEFNVNGF